MVAEGFFFLISPPYKTISLLPLGLMFVSLSSLNFLPMETESNFRKKIDSWVFERKERYYVHTYLVETC